jgi:hypothetical protein
MREKQPDGSPTGSPASTDEPLSSPQREQGPLSKRAPGAPPVAGFRNGFAKWVIAAGQPPAAPRAPAVSQPALDVVPPADPAPPPPSSELVEVRPIPAKLPSVPPDERTQMYQRLPEQLLRRARSSEPAPAGPSEEGPEEEEVWDARFELGARPRVPYPAEDERTAAFTPPTELLSAAKRRKGMVGPAAGTPPPPRPSSPELAADGSASSPEEDAIDEMSARIAALSGAHKGGEDVTRVTASYRRLMASEHASSAPPELQVAPAPAGLPSVPPERRSRARAFVLGFFVLLALGAAAAALAHLAPH